MLLPWATQVNVRIPEVVLSYLARSPLLAFLMSSIRIPRLARDVSKSCLFSRWSSVVFDDAAGTCLAGVALLFWTVMCECSASAHLLGEVEALPRWQRRRAVGSMAASTS